MSVDPRFVSNSDRVANRAVVDAEISAVFSRFDREELATILQTAKIAWSRLNGLEDVVNHPLLREITASFGAAKVKLVDLPVKTDGVRPSEVPMLGQHSDTIRQEFS
jgi:crotonobetainyl-CoA:carnitine CoA-transferase CaiB-like acyl-CoA transferase